MSKNQTIGQKVAEDLKVMLVRRDSNKTKLAKDLGVSGSTIYTKFLRGNFSTNDLDAICKALNLTCEIKFKLNDSDDDSEQ